jgi:DNA-binding LacI/PurR family transcriptional regulator
VASVRQIARRAGVSITTVSRVLNNHPQVSEEVREKVLAATNKAGYVQAVGRRSTTNIAFAYTGESSLGSPFDAALMQGMAQVMEEFGFDLTVLDARRAKLPHETYTQMFLRKGIRGAILRTTAQAQSVCEAIAAEHFPAVVVGSRFNAPDVNFVDCDSRESSREAVEHLVGLGHRRVAVCVNVVDDSDHADRLAGYEQALTENGIEFDARLVLRTPANRLGGSQVMRRIMSMADRPTAVYLTDPMAAVGALNEARKMGVGVPTDLSVVGFDDAELRFGVSPEMTSVCQDAVQLGREAFNALNRILNHQEDGDGQSSPLKQELRTWLEIHETTGKPPARAIRILPDGTRE